MLRGAVVLVGVVDDAKALHQATEIPIRGLVCGSMASELIPIALRMPYPILVTEGFGAIPMNSATYDLAQHKRREGSECGSVVVGTV